MSDVVRIQADGKGNIERVDHDVLSKAMVEKPSAAPSEPVVRQGGIKTRYEAATDSMTVLSDGRDHSRDARITPASSDPLDNARSADGSRIVRGALTENSIIDHPALGGSMRLKEALALGWVRKLADGYVMAGEMAHVGVAPGTTPDPATKQQDAPKDDNEISLAGVEGTSAGVDLVKGQIRKAAGETVFTGLTTAYIMGSDPTSMVEEIARRSGRPASEIREATDGIFSEYQRSARQIAAANGVPERAFDSMVTWASENLPDAALDAFHRLVENHDAAGVARIAKQFARTGRVETAWSVQDVLSAQLGDGVRSFQKDGKAWVELQGHGSMTFERAVRSGLIRLS